MIGILKKKNFFHVGDEDLAIDVAYFVLGQYYGCSRIVVTRSSRLLDIQNEKCGWRWWIGCGKMRYQASVILFQDSHLLNHTMYLTMEYL